MTATWPLKYRPETQSFYVRTLTARFTNPYTSQTQVLERDGAMWMSSMTLSLSSDQALSFEAFLAGLKGPAGEVLVPDYRRLKALGSGLGSPQLVSGSGIVLTLSGFTPNAVGVLKAGDLIQTSAGRVHMVLDDVAASSNGEAVVKVSPRLRDPVSVGPLVTNNCMLRMRLLSDDAGKNLTKPPLKASYQIDLIEALS
ncbi:DUF4198 domain-containing protein [Azospirillaceae bacterium]